MTKELRKPPSRIKYEQTHPTVSCRVPRGVYEKLRIATDKEGKSFADILKIGLGIVESRAKKEEEVRKAARADGYEKGYAEAMRCYLVSFPCSVCGEEIEVVDEETKQAVRQYMQEHGWQHGESCS